MQQVAGTEAGQRQLNGPQTTGREYRHLSQPEFATRRTNNVGIAVRDGTLLLADLFQPDADGRFEPHRVSRRPVGLSQTGVA